MRPIRKRRRRPIGQPTLNFKRVLRTPSRPRTQSVRRNRHHLNMTATPNKRPAQSRAETSLLVNSIVWHSAAPASPAASMSPRSSPIIRIDRSLTERFFLFLSNCLREILPCENVKRGGYRPHYDSLWSSVARPGGITDAPDYVGGVPVVNQIRIYWWCSPPRTGRQRMCPVRSTARETGVSFSRDRCVRTSL
jgi:hypothetical protein